MEFCFRWGLAPSTHEVYTSAQKWYSDLCELHQLQLLPASELHICKFVSYLADSNVSHTFIKVYLSALRQFHIANEYPDPKIGDMPKMEQVLRGIKREQRKANPKTHNRLPTIPGILRRIQTIWERDAGNPNLIMLWVASCLRFFGFMRAGEMTAPSKTGYDSETHLGFNDIAIDDPSMPSL